MDILMISWNSVWRSAIRAPHFPPRTHTADEWAAFNRSLKRRNPSESALLGADR